MAGKPGQGRIQKGFAQELAIKNQHTSFSQNPLYEKNCYFDDNLLGYDVALFGSSG